MQDQEAHFCGGIRGEVEIYASFTFESVTRTIHHLLVSDSRKYRPPTVGSVIQQFLVSERRNFSLKKAQLFPSSTPLLFSPFFFIPPGENSRRCFFARITWWSSCCTNSGGGAGSRRVEEGGVVARPPAVFQGGEKGEEGGREAREFRESH